MRPGGGFRLVRERIESTFWLRPLVIIIAIVGLLYLPDVVPKNIQALQFLQWSLFKTTDTGAQLILSALATGLMTVVGVLFSITMVVLQQASTQFTPRIMEKFIRSGPSKNVLGFYIGTFLYSLLLLNQTTGETRQIPQFKISLAIALAFVCLWILVLYIHHIIHSIKSTRVVADVVQEAESSLESLTQSFRGWTDYFKPRQLAGLPFSYELKIPQRGYIEGIHWERMDEILSSRQFHLDLHVSPGDYVIDNQPVAVLYSDSKVNDVKELEVLTIFKIGEFRTYAEDVRFPFRQLSDIALRSLSPAMNDPTTATEAINGMGALLYRCTQDYNFPQQVELEEGQTIHFHYISFANLVELSFCQILPILEAKERPLLQRIQKILSLCLDVCQDEDRRQTLLDMKRFVLAHEQKIYDAEAKKEGGYVHPPNHFLQ